MKKIILLVLCISLTAISGCANSGNKSVKNVSQEQAERTIVAGETSKQDIQRIFGAPIETDYTDGGLLIWKYRYDDTSALNLETVASVYFTLGLAGTKSKGTRNELVVLFDENDIVKRFNMSNSPIEIGTGIF